MGLDLAGLGGPVNFNTPWGCSGRLRKSTVVAVRVVIRRKGMGYVCYQAVGFRWVAGCVLKFLSQGFEWQRE